MKTAVISISLLIWSFSLIAQSTNDRRGFQGVVKSSAKESIRPDGKDETSVNTSIEFTGRAIVLEGDTYEIVKKTFDGKNKTVFTCTKRRATFDITYSVGESIWLVDTSNKGIITVFKSLTEK